MPKVIKSGAAAVLTANDLLSGQIVYWGDENKWVSVFSNAKHATSDSERILFQNIGKQQEQSNVVVNSYLVELTADSDTITPILMREIYRLQGPGT